MTVDAAGPPSLQHWLHLLLVVAMIALVTLGALENRATGTVLPVVADDLGGLTWFGAATTGPGLTYVVAVVLAGAWIDRRGPGPAIFTGVGLFLLGQAVIATEPSMIVVVLGRLASGVAEGLFDIGITVLIVVTIPEALRPRMMSLIAMAWILPSVLGPQAAGLIADRAGWRWVFLLGGLLAIPVTLALIGSVRRAGGRSEPAEGPGLSTLPYAIAVAGTMGAAAALAPLAGVGGPAMIGGAALVLILVVAGIWCARPLLPAGTLTLRRGLGTTVLLGGALSVAFATGSSFLPLMLIERAGFTPGLAGLSMPITGLFWALGSWLQGTGRAQRRTTARLRVRTGFTGVAVGLFAVAGTAVGLVPPALGLAGWAVAGVGIGLASSTLSVHRLALTDDAEQGRVAAGSTLLGSAGISGGAVIVGYGIAASAPHPPGELFLAAFGAAGLLAVAGATLAGRIRPDRSDRPEPADPVAAGSRS